MIDNRWQRLVTKFYNIDLDEYVIMPNHLHGIIVIRSCRGEPMCSPEQTLLSNQTHPCTNAGRHTGLPLQKRQSNPTLGQIIQWFKTMTTNYYIQGIHTKNWPMFNKRLWQRNYYEHIIRNEQTLNKIRKYVRTNLLNWETDRNNPKNLCQRKNNLQFKKKQ